MKGKIDKYAITIGDFNNCFSKTGRAGTQEISKEIEDLNTIKNHDLTDKYRTFNPTVAEYTLFPQCPWNLY